ncbi:TPA: hypothetical protein DCX16_01120 [bacterium]|nr:hypothetical protein [bacterium]
MQITLVSPRIAIQKGDFLGSGIPYWPVELAILAAFLREQENNKIFVLDLFGTSPTTVEEKADYYLQGKPFYDFIEEEAVTDADLFILYAISYMSHKELLSIAKCIRRVKPNAKICILENSQAVTGYALPEKSDEFFRYGVDALLCGDVYWNWNEIIAYFKNPKEITPPENILVSNPPKTHSLHRKIEKNIRLPIPAWELFPIKNYWSLPYSHGPKTKKYLPMLTSRGCPYSCDFCIISETNSKKWRARTPQEVVNEIIILRDKYGVRHFQIEDLNPTVNGSRWEEICKLLIEKDVGIFFYFASGTKAETIKLDKIPEYAKGGCRYISISPESGSPSVISQMGKSFDHAHGLKLIEACNKYGIYTQTCFLVGHPSEKPEDHKLSCDYLRSLVNAGLDEVAVFIIAPFPGSLLYKENEIEMSSSKLLTSFSPRGRKDWDKVMQKRRELIKIFFIEKLKKKPLSLFLQGIRALLGIPSTKMENLPRRILFVYFLLLKHKLNCILYPKRRKCPSEF